MTLKKIAPIFLLLLLATSCGTDTSTTTAESPAIEDTQASDATPIEEVAAGEFEFRGDTYLLANIKADGKETINVYLPEGESEAQWTTMVNLFEHPEVNNASRLVTTLKDAVLQVDPETPYEIWSEGGAEGIDFLTFDEATSTFAYTLFAYADNPSDKGLIAHQYSQQFPLAEAEAFVENYDQNRGEIRDDILAQNFPAVTKE